MDKYANGGYDCPAPASSRTSITTNNPDDEMINRNLNFVDNLNPSSQTEDTAGDVEFMEVEDSDQEKQYENYQLVPIKTEMMPLPWPLSSKNQNELPGKREGLENVLLPPTEDVYSVLRKMINNYVQTNVKICIGTEHFNCHIMVLQCYSEYFMECHNEEIVRLPEKEVTPGAFLTAYKWMVADAPLIQREGIVELYKAAKYLRIKDLANQCWVCLSDEENISEANAFFLYMDARNCGGLEILEELMLMRISRFFSTLVTTTEFVQLPVKDILILLGSNSIGVNSEMEVFMSAILWLDYNWDEREEYTSDVMKMVRFNLMPLWFLVALSRRTGYMAIDQVLIYYDVIEMVRDAISYIIKQRVQPNRTDLVAPVQREWMFDEHCNFHHCLDCPKMEYINYDNFLNHLQNIKKTGKDYWRSLEFRDKNAHCCKPSNN